MDEWDDNLPSSSIALVCEEISVLEDAIKSGIGIGFLREVDAKHDPNLIEVMPNREEWNVPIWLVTHLDQHKAPKVQACIKHLKEWASENRP